VTTSAIAQYSPQSGTGFNYYIEASPGIASNSITYRLITNNDYSWSSIDVSYIACSRSDVSVGNFEAPVNIWIPATSNIYNVNINVSRALPSDSYYVAAFISGFSTVDAQF
jgi:hypothetical protein